MTNVSLKHTGPKSQFIRLLAPLFVSAFICWAGTGCQVIQHLAHMEDCPQCGERCSHCASTHNSTTMTPRTAPAGDCAAPCAPATSMLPPAQASAPQGQFEFSPSPVPPVPENSEPYLGSTASFEHAQNQDRFLQKIDDLQSQINALESSLVEERQINQETSDLLQHTSNQVDRLKDDLVFHKKELRQIDQERREDHESEMAQMDQINSLVDQLSQVRGLSSASSSRNLPPASE